MKKMWDGRFNEASSELLEEFNASIFFDKELFKEDIAGSKAHAKMLGECGILDADDVAKIRAGLDQVLGEIERGEFAFSVSQEDIHMAVEGRLSQIIGKELGGRLHTARSRNDQVALDFRAYCQNRTKELAALVRELISVLASIASEHKDTLMPGFTHLQHLIRIRHCLFFLFAFYFVFSDFSSGWSPRLSFPLIPFFAFSTAYIHNVSTRRNITHSAKYPHAAGSAAAQRTWHIPPSCWSEAAYSISHIPHCPQHMTKYYIACFSGLFPVSALEIFPS